MSNRPLNLTRDQIAAITGGNPRAIRALEQLLKSVGDLTPTDIETLHRLINETFVEASSASSKADQALDALIKISRSLELLALAPSYQSSTTQQDVAPPASTTNLANLADVSAKLPVAGSVLIYDTTLKYWKSAIITPGTNLTITNADGSITVNATSSAVETHAAASKTTPVDADEMPLADSASSFTLKKLTWANLKATMLSYLSSALFTGLNIVGTGAAFRSLNFMDTASPSTVFASIQFESSLGEVRYSSGFAGWGGFQTFYTNGNLQLTLNDTNATFTKPLIIPGGTLLRTSAALTNGAATATATMTNAPVAGNPTKWIPINDNGTTRYVPAW